MKSFAEYEENFYFIYFVLFYMKWLSAFTKAKNLFLSRGTIT